MMKRSPAVLVSLVLLVWHSLQSAISIPAAFVPRDLGQFTRAAQMGSGFGAIFWAITWAGLAYAQWTRKGAWGRRIGILALIVLGIQTDFTYVAIRSGRVSPDLPHIARHVIFTLFAFGALSIASFISFAEFRRRQTMETAGSLSRG